MQMLLETEVPTEIVAPAATRGPVAPEKDNRVQPSKEIYIAILAALGIATYLGARYLFGLPEEQAKWPLIVSLLAGIPLLFDLLLGLAKLRLSADLLAGISIAASVALGQYLPGAIVVLMLSGGVALENHATRRASAVLGALAKRMPRLAHRCHDGKIVDVGLADVALADRLIVFPHEICPVDGVIIDGRGTMDESYLTGEPFHIAKASGSEVLSGAVNGEAALTIEVTHLPADSRYAKITRVIQQAEANRPRMRRIADRLGAWYTLFGLAIAVLGWVAGNDPSRFLAVLVIATPCPLLLAMPIAIIGAISVAASRAIIIKNPAMLERIDSCRTVIFDKTGTLTYGRPTLTSMNCASDISEQFALQMAASLEQYSKHPLAGAVMDRAQRDSVTLAPLSDLIEKPGYGLSGRIGSIVVRLTGRPAVLAEGGAAALDMPPAAPGLECILLLDGTYAATFSFHDAPRTDSRSFVGHLGPHHQVQRVMLLSGDREEEVRYLAAEVGITEVLFGKSPEEKLAIVREEARAGPTLFLGDGINDAPAMQAATVGIAFGQNSDITAETADAVILETSLAKVDELIHIGRRMRTIALQSAIGGMALSIVGMGLAAAGYLPPVAGAIAQEVIDVAAVLNALRVARTTKDLRDNL